MSSIYEYLVKMMESLVAGDSEDSENLAILLFDLYNKRNAPVSEICSRVSAVGARESITEALMQLEQESRIYIERNPRIQNAVLRTDIQDEDVIYFDCFPTIERKSLLYKTRVEYGDYTINHLLGCAHGCTYPCYAMNISKRYGRVIDYEDWLHPRLVGNALDLLEMEIPKLNGDINFVHLSFMTDPFMHDAVNRRTLPWVQDATLKIIQRLNSEDIKVTVLSKGIYPDALAENSFSKQNEYGITLVSLDSEFISKYEPFSPLPEERIAALKHLHDKGLKTWASLEPYPTPNIVQQDIIDILEKVAFVDKLIFGKWNYNPEVNDHRNKMKFYTRCSDAVIDFCEQYGISLHIKEHTPKSSLKTNNLFSE